MTIKPKEFTFTTLSNIKITISAFNTAYIDTEEARPSFSDAVTGKPYHDPRHPAKHYIVIEGNRFEVPEEDAIKCKEWTNGSEE